MRRVVVPGLVVAAVLALAGPQSVQAQTPRVAWHVDVPVTDLTYHPRSAGTTTDIATIWANGSVTATVDLPATATHLLFDARADRCDGVGAVVEVRVDGELHLTHEVLDNNQLARDGRSALGVYGETWAAATYGVRGEWGPGSHHVSFRFTNDRRTATCDRNLKLSLIRFVGPGDDGGGTAPVVLRQVVTRDAADIEPEHARAPRGVLWAPGTLRFQLDSLGADTLQIDGWRRCTREEVAVRVDGETIGMPWRVFHGPWGEWTYAEAFGRPGTWSDGSHVIEIELLADGSARCDDTIGVEALRFSGRP